MPKAVKKKKPFVNKKSENTHVFKLGHRSQRDPLAADDTAPQHILIQQKQKKEKNPKQKEEERKFGIFYDDEYDYLQHVKDREVVEHDWESADKFLLERKKVLSQQQQQGQTEEEGEAGPSGSGAKKGQLQLSSQVFASKQEEEVGLLNKAAPRSGPRLDWDPEIVETLDDDYKAEQVFTLKDLEKEMEGEDDEELENAEEDDLDDFLARAMASGDEEEDDDEGGDMGSDFGSYYGSEEADELGSLEGGFAFDEEETKSKFTEYSMSSSVIPRSENLALLDDRFEKFFDNYDEEITGGLDFEEIEGFKADNGEVMKQILAEHKKNKELERQKPDFAKLPALGDDSEDEEGAKPELEMVEVQDPREKWDCESILSTYSNIYHHPKLISEPSKKVQPIRISGKSGLPKDVFGKGLTMSALKKLDQANDFDQKFGSNHETATLASRVSELSIRNKHETVEERKARKNAFKELKKERRLERKANKEAFKEEKVNQERNMVNNRKNVQGKKLL